MPKQVPPVPLLTSQAGLAYFVSLKIVFEMNPCIQRPIMLFCLVLKVDPSKSQTHTLRRRLVIGAAMCNTGDDNVIHLDDQEFLLRSTCFPVGYCRFLQVGTRCTGLHKERRGLVDFMNDDQVLEGCLAHAASTSERNGTRVRHAPRERQYLDF